MKLVQKPDHVCSPAEAAAIEAANNRAAVAHLRMALRRVRNVTCGVVDDAITAAIEQVLADTTRSKLRGSAR